MNLISNLKKTVEKVQTKEEAKMDCIKVNGNITFKKTNTLSFVLNEEKPEAGEYVLMECNGIITADVDKIQTRGLIGLNYSIEVKENKLIINIRDTRDAAEGVVWTGHQNKLWDYQSDNFILNEANTAFVANDQVIFNDETSVQFVPGTFL